MIILALFVAVVTLQVLILGFVMSTVLQIRKLNSEMESISMCYTRKLKEDTMERTYKDYIRPKS